MRCWICRYMQTHSTHLRLQVLRLVKMGLRHQSSIGRVQLIRHGCAQETRFLPIGTVIEQRMKCCFMSRCSTHAIIQHCRIACFDLMKAARSAASLHREAWLSARQTRRAVVDLRQQPLFWRGADNARKEVAISIGTCLEIFRIWHGTWTHVEHAQMKCDRH